MTVFRRGIALTTGLIALVLAGGAWAQENLDEGKSPAQLYQGNCAICHKTVRGMTRAGGAFGLESFLREHYTASRESAAAIARYVQQMDRGPLPAEHKQTAQPGRHEPRGATDKKKAAEKKSGKGGEAKATEKKPAETKSLEGKPAEMKPSDKKPEGTKPSEKKSDEKDAMSATPAKPKASEKPKPKADDSESSAPKSGDKPSDKPDQPKDSKPPQ